MNDTSEDLTRELREASHAMDGGALIDLADVKQSARRIQRRRRVAAGAVAAAVVAVAAPIGFAVTSTTPAPDNHTPPPWVTGRRDASPTIVPGNRMHVPLTFDGLPTGASPDVPYLFGNALVTGRSTLDLPEEYVAITRYHGGHLVVVNDEGDTEVVTLDADANELERRPGADRLALSGDETGMAYFVVGAGGRGELHIGSNTPNGSRADEPVLRVAPGTTLRPVGFTRSGVAYDTGDGTVGVMDYRGRSHVVQGLVSAGGTDQYRGLVSGRTSLNADGSVCSAVVAEQGDRRLFETCDHDLGRFSPGGQFVLGLPAYQSGFGQPSLAILDASTGAPVVTLEQEKGSRLAIIDAVWEDESHVLLIVVDGLDFRIERLGVDGSVESVTQPVEGQEGSSPIRFATTP